MKFQYKKHRAFRLIVLAIVTLPLFFFNRTASAHDRQKCSIFFYNSEININNFVSIKIIHDKYFSRHGNFNFQPFDDMKICEETFRKANLPTALVISSWHFRSFNKKVSLLPLLIATRNGKPFFKKVLSVKKSFRGFHDLAGKVVASASSVENTRELLLKMFGKNRKDLLLTVKILTVPKDIDALLAVGYSIAHAAVTTQESLKLLKSINPGLKRKLKTLSASGDMLMPVLVIKKSGVIGEPQKKIMQIMKEMKTSENGRESLSAMSIDGWIDISPEIMEKLLK